MFFLRGCFALAQCIVQQIFNKVYRLSLTDLKQCPYLKYLKIGNVNEREVGKLAKAKARGMKMKSEERYLC